MVQRIEGTVVSITESGNLVTDITADQLAAAPRDERVTVGCGGHETTGIFPADHHQPEATLVAMISPNGTLEMAIVGMNMSEMLHLQVGQKVVVQWE